MRRADHRQRRHNRADGRENCDDRSRRGHASAAKTPRRKREKDTDDSTDYNMEGQQRFEEGAETVPSTGSPGQSAPATIAATPPT
jgi:hypothetical protein